MINVSFDGMKWGVGWDEMELNRGNMLHTMFLEWLLANDKDLLLVLLNFSRYNSILTFQRTPAQYRK